MRFVSHNIIAGGSVVLGFDQGNDTCHGNANPSNTSSGHRRVRSRRSIIAAVTIPEKPDKKTAATNAGLETQMVDRVDALERIGHLGVPGQSDGLFRNWSRKFL